MNTEIGKETPTVDAYDRGVVLDVQIIWAGSSVGSSSGLKIHVSAVQVRPGPPPNNFSYAFPLQ